MRIKKLFIEISTIFHEISMIFHEISTIFHAKFKFLLHNAEKYGINQLFEKKRKQCVLKIIHRDFDDFSRNFDDFSRSFNDFSHFARSDEVTTDHIFIHAFIPSCLFPSLLSFFFRCCPSYISIKLQTKTRARAIV